MRHARKKRFYYAVVDRSLNIVGNIVFDVKTTAEELCFKKNSYSRFPFKVMRIAIMGESKNWKKPKQPNP